MQVEQSVDSGGALKRQPPPGAIVRPSGGWIKPLQKGQTNNPGGRSAKQREIQRACAERSMEMVEFLISVVRDEKEDTRNRIVAALEINNRGLGKPKELPDEKPRMTLDPRRLTDEQIAFLAQLIQVAAVPAEDAQDAAPPTEIDGQATEAGPDRADDATNAG